MVGMVNNRAGVRKRPFIMELVGLAGAGKTTLARALSQYDENIRIDDDLALRKRAHLPIFAGSTPTLLPLILQQNLQSRGFTWNEIKAMAYLKGWPPFLAQQKPASTTILLDHGPIFKMTTLKAFGPAKLQSPRFDKWWQRTFVQWSNTLNMVIWLYAPQKILVERINARNQRHAVKGKSVQEATQFLERYQSSYKQVFAELEKVGAPRQIQFDTSQISLEQIVEEVIAATSQNFYKY